MFRMIPPGLAEAARLTRQGRLKEATALLQGSLAGTRPKPTPARPATRGRIFEVDPATGDATPPGRAGFFSRAQGRPRPAPPLAMPEGARFLRGGFGAAQGERAWRLYIPASLPAGPVPLLVMLHGCTQTPEDFAAGTRMNALAEAEPRLVLYPEQSGTANAQRCWNWFQPGDQRRDQGEPALIAGMVRQVMRDHAVDPRRVHVAGLSAGGAAAAIMGESYPELFAAVGVHSGLACGAAQNLPSALAAMRQGGGTSTVLATARPTIVFHADQDRTVHPVNGDQVMARAGAAGLRAEVERGQVPGGHAFTRTRHSDTAGRVMLEQWLVHGGGHAWSGGDAAGSYTDPLGPDASRAMLDFFRRHG
ncbi:extracellular catalytic domain type 1 short-chain-length polyhydroxyalkanoate depolymerase [Falsiroseomonas tokyonensis]|uniref:Alpha/beta hydrolase family esterase n=1 Tax=Falsiroseomonas tokyonensis TaxID=430521 RepID=A0ABV7BXP1_9PROT|nr:PHB depolymerase family esterase [Falsiroseomonas tokyonensis]MBU8540039.1 PHB depolymerase family esterase [Falsiroseomonas tokyonensis]